LILWHRNEPVDDRVILEQIDWMKGQEYCTLHDSHFGNR
jgi:hypothetical protein